MVLVNPLHFKSLVLKKGPYNDSIWKCTCMKQALVTGIQVLAFTRVLCRSFGLLFFQRKVIMLWVLVRNIFLRCLKQEPTTCFYGKTCKSVCGQFCLTLICQGCCQLLSLKSLDFCFIILGLLPCSNTCSVNQNLHLEWLKHGFSAPFW